ncbi:uncharacterized protein EHS24_005081 [Apiotrichum porosum]|uniref:Uncharacterized protein n=1 Tax=Apiotrichum porosum TaxID=105984 RepID=A0A427Y6T9_9TREE|nr:uncharacterized protein EHS24_005081 [Apiotrichum porosum]RSH86807.1 hypothetical protein EHS24_005081 [Apiotrichum porosum]
MSTEYKKGDHPWKEEHSTIIAEGIINLIMAHRSDLYRLPGIAGIVDGHGNDRTSRKIKQMATQCAKTLGVSEDLVKSAKASSTGQRGRKRTSDGEATASSPKTTRNKKVKQEKVKQERTPETEME